MNRDVRIYRMKSTQRAVAIALLCVGLLLSFVIWRAMPAGTPAANFFQVMAPVAFSLAAALFVFRSYRNMVCLSERSISVHGLSGTRILPLDKIRGRRHYVKKHGRSPDVWHLVVESAEEGYPTLDIEEVYKFDEGFYHWFNGLADLDKMDRKNARELEIRA